MKRVDPNGSVVAPNEAETDAWLAPKWPGGENRDASPEPIDQLGKNGGPPPVTKVGSKKRGGKNG